MKTIDHKEIIKLLQAGYSVTETARLCKVSRPTVYKWRRRARSPYTRELSSKLLKLKSRRPKKIYHALNPIRELRLIELRKLHNYDQSKLAVLFAQKYGISISPKTVYNIIKRRAPHLLQSKPKHRRPRFQNGSHMRPANTKIPGYIQADVKYVTPELSGLDHNTYEFGFIDIYSRYKVAWILPNLDQEAAITALRYMLKQMPCTVVHVQTDNGWEFGKQFHAECKRQGIDHYYIHKNSPNENAVIERSFRTDQEEFYYRLERRAEDINELNTLFQEYLKKYNTFRPHFGLKLRTPLDVIQSATSVNYVVTD